MGKGPVFAPGPLPPVVEACLVLEVFMKEFYLTLFIYLILLLFFVVPATSGDLENAKSKSAVRKGDADAKGKDSGDANMNSVVMGAGSNIKGDVYIIDQSRGPKTNVAD